MAISDDILDTISDDPELCAAFPELYGLTRDKEWPDKQRHIELSWIHSALSKADNVSVKLPLPLSIKLKYAIEKLLAGYPSSYLSPVLKHEPGRPKVNGLEACCKLIAVRYRLTINEGPLKNTDRSPVKTIRAAFAYGPLQRTVLSSKAIQNWVRQFPHAKPLLTDNLKTAQSLLQVAGSAYARIKEVRT